MAEHEHKFSEGEWPFLDAVNTAAFTTTRVVRENYPVLLVTHDEDDGSWQILCGTTNESKDCLVVCLGCAFERDRSIGELADLPLGWRAWRKSVDAPWQRGPNEDRERSIVKRVLRGAKDRFLRACDKSPARPGNK